MEAARANLPKLRRVRRRQGPLVSELQRRAAVGLAPTPKARGTAHRFAPEAPADGTKMAGRVVGRWGFVAVVVRTK